MTKINELKNILKIHYDATTPMDAYHTGMFNGIELAISVLEDKEPQYKDIEEINPKKIDFGEPIEEKQIF